MVTGVVWSLMYEMLGLLSIVTTVKDHSFNVDAVYDSDPNVNKDAKKIEALSYIDVLNRGLGVMDSTATSLCMDNHIPIRVFGLNEPDNIRKVILGEEIGTIVK